MDESFLVLLSSVVQCVGAKQGADGLGGGLGTRQEQGDVGGGRGGRYQQGDGPDIPVRIHTHIHTHIHTQQ